MTEFFNSLNSVHSKHLKIRAKIKKIFNVLFLK